MTSPDPITPHRGAERHAERARRRRTLVVASVVALASILSTTVPRSPLGPAPASAGVARCFGADATIVIRSPGIVTVGTPGDDVIVGTPGDDRINGGGGNDRICGGGGDDVVNGNGGRDLIALGAGDDHGIGGRGRDRILGQAGGDTLRGGPGNDRLIGGAGIDSLDGDAGARDRCRGARGVDRTQRCIVRDAGASRSDVPASVAALEAHMVDLVNDLRVSVGVPPLRTHAAVADVARAWSATLPVSFAHNPSVSSLIPAGWSWWGENIGYRWDTSLTPRQLIDRIETSLEASPGHYANLVRPEFTHIGIGVVVVGDGVYVTQVFAQY